MEKTIPNRRTLRNKMAQALNEDIKTLSNGMQTILIDDLSTAFESRLKVLKNAQSEKKAKPQQTYINCKMGIPETISLRNLPQKLSP